MSNIISIILSIIAVFGIRPSTGVVTDVHDGLAYIETTYGEVYTVDMEDYFPSDVVAMIMYNNGTPIIYDDVVIVAHVVSDLNDMLVTFSHVNYQRDVVAEWEKANAGQFPDKIEDID